MLIALTRPVSQSLALCELTHLARTPIDVARAREQHAAYERALESLGVQVVRVAGDDALPDAVFVEDMALALDEIAIITRPGAESRRPETPAVAAVLAVQRSLVHMTGPATLDGGDVLRIGPTLWVGRSSRTNQAGIDQLRQLSAPYGYRVEAVEMGGCLHLKSAATAVGEELLLVNPAWLPRGAFAGMERIDIDPSEAYAANALRVADTVIFPEHFPRTRERLGQRGLNVVTVPCDELAKAEGALTCCSVLFETLA